MNVQRDEVPSNISGKILCIDPGSNHLGYAIYDISTILSQPIVYGTFNHSGINSAKDLFEIINFVDSLSSENSVLYIFCEDYHFIPGMINGIFQVPQILAALRYWFYEKYSKEVIFISSFDWKTSITGIGNSNKLDVYNMLPNFIDDDVWINIKSKFKKTINSGYQDCLDAIAIGKHVDIVTKQTKYEKPF